MRTRGSIDINHDSSNDKVTVVSVDHILPEIESEHCDLFDGSDIDAVKDLPSESMMKKLLILLNDSGI